MPSRGICASRDSLRHLPANPRGFRGPMSGTYAWRLGFYSSPQMLRKFVACVFGSVALIAIAASAAPATAAPEPLIIQVMKGQTALAPDGTVLAPIRARCHPPLDAFEVDVGVQQPTAFGSAVLFDTGFPLCDGRWHRTTVTVAPETGVFVAGRATVFAFIEAFDPTGGGDVDATDAETVKLK